jgi:hypothetical protein
MRKTTFFGNDELKNPEDSENTKSVRLSKIGLPMTKTLKLEGWDEEFPVALSENGLIDVPGPQRYNAEWRTSLVNRQRRLEGDKRYAFVSLMAGAINMDVTQMIKKTEGATIRTEIATQLLSTAIKETVSSTQEFQNQLNLALDELEKKRTMLGNLQSYAASLESLKEEVLKYIKGYTNRAVIVELAGNNKSMSVTNGNIRNMFIDFVGIGKVGDEKDFTSKVRDIIKFENRFSYEKIETYILRLNVTPDDIAERLDGAAQGLFDSILWGKIFQDKSEIRTAFSFLPSEAVLELEKNFFATQDSENTKLTKIESELAPEVAGLWKLTIAKALKNPPAGSETFTIWDALFETVGAYWKVEIEKLKKLTEELQKTVSVLRNRITNSLSKNAISATGELYSSEEPDWLLDPRNSGMITLSDPAVFAIQKADTLMRDHGPIWYKKVPEDFMIMQPDSSAKSDFAELAGLIYLENNMRNPTQYRPQHTEKQASLAIEAPLERLRTKYRVIYRMGKPEVVRKEASSWGRGTIIR